MSCFDGIIVLSNAYSQIWAQLVRITDKLGNLKDPREASTIYAYSFGIYCQRSNYRSPAHRISLLICPTRGSGESKEFREKNHWVCSAATREKRDDVMMCDVLCDMLETKSGFTCTSG